jgi:hypothetical protein
MGESPAGLSLTFFSHSQRRSPALHLQAQPHKLHKRFFARGAPRKRGIFDFFRSFRGNFRIPLDESFSSYYNEIKTGIPVRTAN